MFNKLWRLRVSWTLKYFFNAVVACSSSIDDTEYLFRSQANREHLLSVIDDVENNRNVIISDQKPFQWEKLRFINY